MFIPGLQPALFFQPHSDDIALSCGGTAAIVAHLNRAHIISVFSGQVLPQMITPLALEKHARWNLQDVDVLSETRRAEDQLAADTLGCSIRWLGLPDAIYRGDRYPSNAELFDELHEEELDLAEHLMTEVKGLPEWRDDFAVFVPLAVGDHVDHQIVFELGLRLAGAGHRVFAYEDTPYVIHSPGGLAARLDAVAEHIAQPFEVSIERTLDHKLEAIAAYESQVPVIFRFTVDWRGAVVEHARGRGGGVAAERFWPVLG